MYTRFQQWNQSEPRSKIICKSGFTGALCSLLLLVIQEEKKKGYHLGFRVGKEAQTVTASQWALNRAYCRDSFLQSVLTTTNLFGLEG